MRNHGGRNLLLLRLLLHWGLGHLLGDDRCCLCYLGSLLLLLNRRGGRDVLLMLGMLLDMLRMLRVLLVLLVLLSVLLRVLSMLLRMLRGMLLRMLGGVLGSVLRWVL